MHKEWLQTQSKLAVFFYCLPSRLLKIEIHVNDKNKSDFDFYLKVDSWQVCWIYYLIQAENEYIDK